jgi:hypothetical protein
MYLGKEIVLNALDELEGFHPFYGITFLVFKKHRLPIGTVKEISIDSLERVFMDEFYKPFTESAWYYRVFRPTDRDKKWLDARYPGSGSQSTRTRGKFAQALLHDTRDNSKTIWGWKPNYVEILVGQLSSKKKIPMFYLAVWLFRQRDWDANTTANDIVDEFVEEFNITKQEIDQLFEMEILLDAKNIPLFNDESIKAQDLIPVIGIPPDLPAEGSGILAYLELNGVGPAETLRFEPGKRINLITGDNGLGKTFLLDTSWWALTGDWIGGYEADPSNRNPKNASITYRVAGEYMESSPITVNYDNKAGTWPVPSQEQAVSSLLIYVRADNSFAVWDPAQHYQQSSSRNRISQPYKFTPDAVWKGLEENGNSLCEGLLRDWVGWQERRANEFTTFIQVLKHLSPHDTGELRPGKPIRIPREKRLIPTLDLPYGEIPVLYASEGMRRILSFAYLLVWAWSEHKTASQLAATTPQRRMVILIDELEAHLHPKWQRVVLPALIDVQSELSEELEIQFLIATHSPLVMASVEPIFDVKLDKMFNLDLVERNMFDKEVILQELPFIKYGVIDSWLTEVFELGQPRSTDAEKALEDAKQIQLADNPSSEAVLEVHERLVRLLAANDEFWPRWLYFAEQHGVET